MLKSAIKLTTTKEDGVCTLLGIGVFVLFLSALWYGLSALGELTSKHEAFSVLMKGVFAPREAFTERGWKLRNRAIVVQIIAMTCALTWAYQC